MMGTGNKSMAQSLNRHFYRRPLPSTCIDFASDEGKVIFAEALASGYMNSFFKLSSQFRTQDEPAYCGLTSLVMALNVLEIDPGRIWKGPWRWYHEDMLDCCTPLQTAKVKGINIGQFVCLARCNSLSAEEKLGSTLASVREFRDTVKETMARDDAVLIASYSRKVLEQTGSGHFSPLAGYHEGKDLVLILDTARFKYPPHWVSLELLFKAMMPVDPETGETRGYVLLSRARDLPSLLLFRPSCAFTVDVQPGNLCSQLLNMAREWDNWLKRGTDELQDPSQIISLAVSQMLSLVSQDKPWVSPFCLTLPCSPRKDDSSQLVVKCPQPTCGDEAYSCIIRELLHQFESLQTFQLAKGYLETRTAEERLKLLHLIHTDCSLPGDGTAEQSSSPVCCESPKCLKTSSSQFSKHMGCAFTQKGISHQPGNPTTCEGIIQLGPEHAVTLFLQAWLHSLDSFPCVRDHDLKNSCAKTGSSKKLRLNTDENSDKSKLATETATTGSASSTTFRRLLKKFISQDLSTSGRDCVQEEIKAITFKLHEVMNYHCQKQLTTDDK